MNSRDADFAATTPWEGVIGKPAQFAPTPHAASHLPGGSDPITFPTPPPTPPTPIPDTLRNKTLIRAILQLTRALGLIDPTGTYNLFLSNATSQTEDRTLTLVLSSGEDRTVTLEADLSVTGGFSLAFTTGGADRSVALAGDLVLAGGFGLTLNVTGGSDINLPLTGDVATHQNNSFTVSSLPDPADNDGRVVYVSDGSGGAPCAAISDSVNWLRLALEGPVF